MPCEYIVPLKSALDIVPVYGNDIGLLPAASVENVTAEAS